MGMVPRGCTELPNASLWGKLPLWGPGVEWGWGELKASAMKTRPATEWDWGGEGSGERRRDPRGVGKETRRGRIVRDDRETEAKGRKRGGAGARKRKRPEWEPATALPAPLMTLASHGTEPELAQMQSRRRAQIRGRGARGSCPVGSGVRPRASGLRVWRGGHYVRAAGRRGRCPRC